DDLLKTGALTIHTLIVSVHEGRIELLVELEVEHISQWRARPHIRKSPIGIALEGLGKEPAGIGTAVGRNGELQCAGSRMAGRRVDHRIDTLTVLDYRFCVAGTT